MQRERIWSSGLKLLPLLFLLMFPMTSRLAASAPIVLYSTSFEAGEGFHGGPLTGQNGWVSVGSGGDGILTNAFSDEIQSAFIGFAAPTNQEAFHAVGYHVDLRPLDRQLPLVTFSVKLAVFPSTTTNQEWFDWAFYNLDGKRLFALEFPTGNGDLPVYYRLGDADYQDTGQTYTDSTSYTLKVSMDFATNRWSASLGTTVLVTNQPISLTNALTFSGADAQWFIRDPARPGDDYMVFDQYRVEAQAAPPPGNQVLYFTSFDTAEGFHQGRLVGQNNWTGTGSGGDGILTNAFWDETQSAFVGFAAPTNHESFHSVGYPVNLRPVEQQLALVNFSVKLAVFPSTTTNQEWFDWTFYNLDGKPLFALEFPTGKGALPIYYRLGDGDYQDTGQTYTDSTAYSLSVVMDFATNRWSATLDAAVLATNQPIALTNALTLSRIDAEWILRDPKNPGDDYMIFDAFKVEAAPGSGSPGLPTLQLKSYSAQAGVLLRCVGEPGASYLLESSPDLRTWSLLATLASANGISEFTDMPPASLKARFYRVTKKR